MHAPEYPGVRFFEIDHPASQDVKLSILQDLEPYPADHATYVTANLGEESISRVEIRDIGSYCAEVVGARDPAIEAFGFGLVQADFG